MENLQKERNYLLCNLNIKAIYNGYKLTNVQADKWTKET